MANKIIRTQVLNIFSDCLITRGVKRAIISDLTRNKYHFVPNSLVDMLLNCKGLTKEMILNYYGIENKMIINDYINFLEENELIFWSDVDELKYFPEINLEWALPLKISNIIIDYDNNSKFSFFNILNQIKDLNCQYLQIRCFSYISLQFWQETFECLLDSEVKGIELITKWEPTIKNEDIEFFIRSNPRIHSIVFHSSNKTEISDVSYNSMGNIIFVEEDIINNSYCGQIHWNYFNVNIKLFTEAQHHNTCLNRKISIDVNGEIKNCPSMAKSYGNIKDTTLAEAIEKPGFKDLWDINKDKIHVCKDCEFRYICTDCRAYIENPEDIYSKPLKCGYNPYTAEWDEWSTNPLKQKAIEFYDMQELVKKEK